jgi:small conductance mechanosensitive channel
VLLARFVTWCGRRITQRMDNASTGQDAVVRSEDAKHRGAVAQVLTWVTIAVIWSVAGVLVLERLGVPVSSLVASAAVLGAALGFGAQQVVRTLTGDVVTVPNGVIVGVTNLSRDWARAVVDMPLPVDMDLVRANDLLRKVGDDAFGDEMLRPLLLDAPTVMGVESFEVDQVNLRMVARTLPGKQFDVARELRVRIAVAFQREGLVPPAEPVAHPDQKGA